MRLALFRPGDVVLLLGEGNFSFAVALEKLNLNIQIVATCFEPEFHHRKELENVEYLRQHNVPVVMNVDSTKIHQHGGLPVEKFTKIIFNFPHVGGKMKIHKNREMLRGFFESAQYMISPEGQVLVTLCRGQGGTPADVPMRRWDDSWQITEQAAYGNFVLEAAEAFVPDNVAEYCSTGYRGQDVPFNTEDAVVHVFGLRNPLYCPVGDIAVQRLAPHPMGNSGIFASVLYSEMYEQNPLKNEKSPVSFFKTSFMEEVETMAATLQIEISIRTVSDEEIALHVASDQGVTCQVGSTDDSGYRLRLSPVQVLDQALALLEEAGLEKGFIFFPGMYFNVLSGQNFVSESPVSFQFLFLGKSSSTYIYRYISSLAKKFNREDLSCKIRETQLGEQVKNLVLLANSVVYTVNDVGYETEVCVVCRVEHEGQLLDVCMLYPDKLAEVFFHTKSWRELWADKNEVILELEDGVYKTVLKQPIAYHSRYEFHVTLRCTAGCELLNTRVYHVVWLAAGRIIREVNQIDEFESPHGWFSKTFSITYSSLDVPLCRSKVRDIHNNVVGKILEMVLNVVIR